MAVEHGRLVPRERLGGHGLRSLHKSDVFALTSTSERVGGVRVLTPSSHTTHRTDP